MGFVQMTCQRLQPRPKRTLASWAVVAACILAASPPAVGQQASLEGTWNGTGTSTATRSRHRDNGDRSYDISCTLTVVNVVVPVEHGGDRFPLSGTITRACTITFTAGPREGQTVQRTAVVTFNGTQTATLTIGDKTFDIDLKSRNRTPRP